MFLWAFDLALGTASGRSSPGQGAALAFGVCDARFFQATFAFLGPTGQSCFEDIMKAAHQTKIRTL